MTGALKSVSPFTVFTSDAENQACGFTTPVIPSDWEAEAGESL